MDVDKKVLLTKKEAAKKLRITVRTLDTWAKNGLVKPIKIGRAVRYSPDIINEVSHKQ